MSQVGTIKGYHDGASYNLADIYDEKLITIEKTADLTNAQCVYSFDSTTTGVNTFFANKKKCTDFTSWISTENAKFDYALQFKGTEYIIVPGGASSNVNIPANCESKIEGWFFVDTSADSDEGTFLSHQYIDYRYASNGYSDYYNINYKYVKNGDKISFYIRNVEFTGDINFNEPLYLVWLSKKISGTDTRWGYNNSLYINGIECPSGGIYHPSNYYNVGAFRIGCSYGGNVNAKTLTAPYFKGALSEFKITVPLVDDNVTSAISSVKSTCIPADANMMIRHNNANCYVPLTTDKSLTSTPCLAVRHNNTNYYAIK